MLSPAPGSVPSPPSEISCFGASARRIFPTRSTQATYASACTRPRGSFDSCQDMIVGSSRYSCPVTVLRRFASMRTYASNSASAFSVA